MGKEENKIQKSILDYLNFEQVYCWRNNNVGVYDPIKRTYRKQHNGVSPTDIEGVYDGKFLGIEVKRPMKLNAPSETNYCSQSQCDHIEKINKDNGLAFQARSIDDVELHIVLYEYLKSREFSETYEVDLDRYWKEHRELFNDLEISTMNIADIRSAVLALVEAVVEKQDHEIDITYKKLKSYKKPLALVYARFLEHKYTLTPFFRNATEVIVEEDDLW